MPDLENRDILQQYGNSVCVYKGRIHKVKNVGKQVKILDLLTQRDKLVDFSLKDFQPPMFRLGYANIEENAVFFKRKPARIMQVGINNVNCTYECIRDGKITVEIETKIGAMECPEFALMMLGHYPSLKDAYARALEFKGSCAFDKQFAVDYSSYIYYKGKKAVGYVNPNNEIVWNAGYEHLSLLLKGNHEKVARAFGT